MATKRWIGKAVPVVDQYTVTIGGTPATGNTVVTTANGSDYVLTVGSAVTVADVAAAYAAGFNANAKDSGLIGTESRNVGGQEIIELAEMSAVAEGAVVTITALTAGVPVEFAVSKTGGVTVTKAQTSTATGPKFFDNADNWEGDALPVDGDLILFDTGGGDCSYGLSYLVDNTLSVYFERSTDYEGYIGLPDYNFNGYREYRQQELGLYPDGVTDTTIDFVRGVLGRRGGTTRLDCQTGGNSFDSLRATDCGDIPGEEPNLHLKNGFFTNRVLLGRGRFETMNVTSYLLTIGETELGDEETQVTLSSFRYHPTGSSDLTILGGTTRWIGAPWPLTGLHTGQGVCRIKGGLVILNGIGDYDTFTVSTGGELQHDTIGDISTVNLYSGGTLNLDGNGFEKSVGVNLYGNSTYIDNASVNSSTPVFVGCTQADVDIQGSL